MDWSFSTRRFNYGVSARRYDLEFCKSGSAIPNMTCSTRNFDPLTPLAPKFPNFAIQILLFRLKHTVAVVTHAHVHDVLQNFYTTWIRGVACQKQRLGPKLEGGAALGEHPKNVGPPTYFCIFATVDASHFTFGTQIGFGTNLPKTTFRTKIGGGVCARGATEKIWDPLLISATVEASNFKFGT